MSETSETLREAGGNTKKPLPNQLKHWFFTYNNYSNPSVSEFETIEMLIRVFNNICYMYCFQEEIGESGTPHLQGIISLHKRARYSEFGLPKGIHWEKPINIVQSYKYCCKDDSRKIGTHPYTKNYNVPKTIRIIPKSCLYDWQLKLLDVVATEPDDRKVYWIYSREGRTGKSTFCKYLLYHYNAIFIDEGKKADIMFCLFKGDIENKNLVVFDIPRDNMDDMGNVIVSYKSIESIKNGMIFSSKFESGFKLFNPPHVFVFSNGLPDYTKLSMDRWKVIHIDE
jgi:hypothetical protein